MPKKKKRTLKKVKKAIKKVVTQKSSANEVSWQAPEFPFHEKGIIWWLLFVLSIALLLTIAYWFDSWWSMVFIVFVVLIIVMHSFRHPKIILCKVDYKGTKVGGRFFAWNELKSFWFIPQTSEPYVMLYLKTTHRVLPIISVEISWKEVDLVFHAFSKKIPLEEQAEPFFDKVGRALKL